MRLLSLSLQHSWEHTGNFGLNEVIARQMQNTLEKSSNNISLTEWKRICRILFFVEP